MCKKRQKTLRILAIAVPLILLTACTPPPAPPPLASPTFTTFEPPRLPTATVQFHRQYPIAFLSMREWKQERIFLFPRGVDVFTTLADGSRLPVRVSLATDQYSCMDDFFWSPDRLWLVYVVTKYPNYCLAHYGADYALPPSGAQIYIVASDGSKHMKVADGKYPCWSPDGSEIAFRCEPLAGSDGICAINVHSPGSELRWLGEGTHVRWSPQGTHIAVILGGMHSATTRIRDIFVMNATDGSGRINVSNSQETEYQADWSPDGTRIVFVSDLETGDEIFVVRADGSEKTNVSRDPAKDFDPVWSPDGTRIAFVSNRDKNYEIYLVNADGIELTNFTNLPESDEYNPAWSPDGTRLAFESKSSGDSEIFVMNVDGTGKKNLSNHPAADTHPIWSPDGMQIAFVSARDRNLEIYVVNDDGSVLVNVSNDGADDWLPRW